MFEVTSLDRIGVIGRPNVAFFVGAGASIPAGLSSVVGLVSEFRNWLRSENKTDHLEIIDKIIATIQKWKVDTGDKTEIDIELLLETIEKLENRDRDVLTLFYAKNTFSLSNCKGYELISDGGTLSREVKQFIKTFFTEKQIKIGYLRPLLEFIKRHKPLSIFSTNYDVCIEEFCKVVGKEYVDGFNPKWNPEEVFGDPNSDVRLYKLHGSVTWYRSEEGDYESSRIMVTNMRVRLATGQEAVPFIVYPGRKLEYNEPTIDLLVELRRQLKSIKYLFVIGYSFKDNHIAKVFKYASKANRNLVLILVSPAAHETYYFTLKRHIDEEFGHGFMHEGFDGAGFDIDLPSELEQRVIRLPYKFEKIVHLLKDKYLDNLKKGEDCERLRDVEYEASADKQIAASRWYECLIPYIECEYIDKVEEIIEKKIHWDELLYNRDYRLGCRVIVKSLLNSLPFEPERIKWLNRLRIYVPIPPQKLEFHIENKQVHILFRFHGESPLHGSEALNFYRSLLDIYKDHLIFSDNESMKVIDNGERRIKDACEYLDIWKNNVLSLNDYIQIRKNAYANRLSTIQTLLRSYEVNEATKDDITSIEQVLCELEKNELGHYYDRQ